MLQKQERGLACTDGKILLDFFALFATKGGIGQDDVETILFLHVGKVLGKCVGVDDVGRFDAVQDHVHDRDDVGQGLLFLAEESALLQRAVLGSGPFGVLSAEVLKGFAKEACRTDGGVADGLPELWVRDRNNGANQWTWGVVLAAVAPGVPHVFDLGFVEVRQLVLLGLGLEAEFVDVVDGFAQVVTALDTVLDLAKDFADLVFDGVRAGGLLLEAVQVREELGVNEGD